jgi:hypothetical protein
MNRSPAPRQRVRGTVNDVRVRAFALHVHNALTATGGTHKVDFTTDCHYSRSSQVHV